MNLLFFSLGGGEIFIILLVILLLFGSKRIPEIARGLGKGIRQFKDATNDIQQDLNDSIKDVKQDIEKTKKELIEETGYKSRYKLRKITSFYTEPGRLTTKITGFFCNNLIKISKPEKGIKIHIVSDQQIIKLIKNGKFNNASHIGMFLFYKKKYAR